MMKPLSRTQKLIAYGSLVAVLICTLFGLFVIWVYISEVYLK